MRKFLSLFALLLTAAAVSAQTIYPDPTQTGILTGAIVNGQNIAPLTVVTNSVTATGTVSAAPFVGDGSGLTGTAPGLTAGGTSGNAATATKLQTARTISVSGDLTYTSPSFDGSASVTAVGTLPSVVSAGTCTVCAVTVDAKGRVTALASGSAGRALLSVNKTLYVRTPTQPVTFASGGANIGWPSHGLSVNDPVVFSVPPNMGTATVTIATPAVVTKTAHGYLAGQPLHWDTTGALPTGLSTSTVVYVLAAGLATDTFEVALTPGGAAINTTGSQSGTHYLSRAGALPTFSTAGALVPGVAYYVKTVPGANSVTLSTTPSGTALGTATLATGSPVYAASTGNDSNDGSAADQAHAMLTVQHAIDVLAGSLDFAAKQGVQGTVQMADGVYNESPILKSLSGLAGYFFYDGSGTVTYAKALLLGNDAVPSNVRFIPADQATYPFTFNAAGQQSAWRVSGLTVDATAQPYLIPFGAALRSYLELGRIDVVGDAGATTVFAYSIDGALLRTSADAHLRLFGPWDTGVITTTQGQMDLEMDVLDFVDSSSFSGSILKASGAGWITYYANTVNGSPTGKRFNLFWGGGLNTFGTAPTALPGSIAGTTDGSARYNQFAGATATNDSAPAGLQGEYGSVCVASGAAVTLSNATTANVGTITLTLGGDYDFEGNINFLGTGATVTAGQGAISTTSATLPTDGSEVYDGTVTTTLTDTSGIALPRKRVSLTAGASVFFVAQKTFSAGSEKAFGCLNWRRVR